jgi:hypothetical protein
LEPRVLDLLDRREQSLKICEELSGDPDNPQIIVNLAGSGLHKPFNEKNLAGLMIDFPNGEAIE